MSLKIAIGSDHAGFNMKKVVLKYLQNENYITADFGPYTEDSVDYPDVAHKLSEAIENGEYEQGILLCGTGNGVCITANKHSKIRAGLAWDPEIASLIRKHNNAQIMCLPARYIDEETAIECVKTFIETDFEGGRHQKRIDKIPV